ncbi:hypothetical protein MA16_Dca006591 [Dendrobium catenatum]|uniref:Uncharacterized protein n=1 Tax=Dendrobium catenatum TaxID=906689 RepID=A0A2I0X5L2_9ASPA|nr:hypothetical protein MA16_Dca006591 [Dendrobium catenatum]
MPGGRGHPPRRLISLKQVRSAFGRLWVRVEAKGGGPVEFELNWFRLSLTMPPQQGGEAFIKLSSTKPLCDREPSSSHILQEKAENPSSFHTLQVQTEYLHPFTRSKCRQSTFILSHPPSIGRVPSSFHTLQA